MDENDLVEQGRALIFQGADHLEVHQYLKLRVVSDEQLKRVLVVLESDFVKYQLAEQERAKILTQVFIGVFILILGTAFLVYQILTNGYRHNIFYAIILVGIWWTYRNYFVYRKPVEYFVPGEHSLRRRRFKKRF